MWGIGAYQSRTQNAHKQAVGIQVIIIHEANLQKTLPVVLNSRQIDFEPIRSVLLHY